MKENKAQEKGTAYTKTSKVIVHTQEVTFEKIASDKEGQVKFFDRKRGFGFITEINTNKDIFIHRTNILRDENRVNYLIDGEKVKFDIVQNKTSSLAVNVIRTSTLLIPIRVTPKNKIRRKLETNVSLKSKTKFNKGNKSRYNTGNRNLVNISLIPSNSKLNDETNNSITETSTNKQASCNDKEVDSMIANRGSNTDSIDNVSFIDSRFVELVEESCLPNNYPMSVDAHAQLRQEHAYAKENTLGTHPVLPIHEVDEVLDSCKLNQNSVKLKIDNIIEYNNRLYRPYKHGTMYNTFYYKNDTPFNETDVDWG